tara:strand:+ start:2426 stop:3079 length:654 start_codon:yes stop_codon:yes gene_type:complete
MENISFHELPVGKKIKNFHIPGNGVIINGLPEKKEEPVLTETEILNSKIHMLENELQKVREEAYDEGFNAYKRSMENENSKKLNSQISFFSEFKSNLENEIKDTVSKISYPIVELSKGLASKILEKELDSSQKWTDNIKIKIENYCQDISENTSINVKINSACIDYLQNQEMKMENGIITFIIDNTLKLGECIIESDSHIIDATFNTQIENIINDIS